MSRFGNKILVVFFIFCFTEVRSQDPHLTQFYASPVYLNPSFAGANVCSRTSLTYRDQWPGINTAFKTFVFSVDHSVLQYNLGLGLLISSDIAGSGDLRTTTINPIVSYGVKISRKMAIRFGVQPGVGFKSINYDKLVFGDQLVRGGGVATVESLPKNKVYFDVGAGALLYSETFWAGLSINHLTGPNVSLIGYEEMRPLKISFHGGAKYHLIKPNMILFLKGMFLQHCIIEDKGNLINLI